MSDELYRLVYYSHNRIIGDAEQAIQQILAASRTNNARAGVTGALLFNAGCFGQVLEGNRRAVEATFERIQCDTRHGEVALLAFEPTSERVFANWSMAFIGNRADDARRYADLAATSGFDPSRMTGDRLFEVLQRLALEEEDSPA